MPTTTPTPPADLSTALAAAASLIAAAALVRVAGAAGVRVVVAGADISIQVPPHGGNHSARQAAVAAYAELLGAQVTRRHSRARREAWIETRGSVGGHDVHVWTVTDPSQEA